MGRSNGSAEKREEWTPDLWHPPTGCPKKDRENARYYCRLPRCHSCVSAPIEQRMLRSRRRARAAWRRYGPMLSTLRFSGWCWVFYVQVKRYEQWCEKQWDREYENG